MSKILHITRDPDNIDFNQHWRRIPFSRCKKWGNANILR